MFRHPIQLIFVLGLLATMLYNCSTPQQLTPQQLSKQSEQAFVNWGKKSKVSFSFEDSLSLQQMIRSIADEVKDKKVVAISEGFHNCEEMFILQQQLIRHLVQEHGFNTIITESGLPESQHINNYIQGQDSTPDFWSKNIALMYAEWEESRQLIYWLRDYNQNKATKIDYFGADIGGFYNDWKYPFTPILEYIATVDDSLHQQLKQELEFYLDLMEIYAAYHYITKLSSAQKNTLASILSELILTFHKNKTQYIAKSSAQAYEWNLQCIKSMSLAENYYRNHHNTFDTIGIPKYAGLNGREIAMAENIDWILQQKKEAKVILINHVVHTKTATQFQQNFYGIFTPMGQYLKKDLKDDLFIIGMTYGKGQYWKSWQNVPKRSIDSIPAAKRDGLEQTLQAIHPGHFYLNLNKAPSPSYYWKEQQTVIRENNYFIQIEPKEWDALFYLHQVSPAKAAKK